MNRKLQAAIALTIVAVVVLIASFMPWGTLRLSVLSTLDEFSPFGGLNLFDDFSPLGDVGVEVKANAWESSLNVIGLQLPNWIVPVVVVVASALTWLLATGVFSTPSWVFVVLGLYAVLHTAIMGFEILSHEGSLGIGIILTLLASIYLLFSAVRTKGEFAVGEGS